MSKNPFLHPFMVCVFRGLYDPRGRSSRFGLFLSWLIAALFMNGLLKLIGSVPFDSIAGVLFWGHMLWINAVPGMRRLHDLGQRGIWFIIGVSALFLLGCGIFFVMLTTASSYGLDIAGASLSSQFTTFSFAVVAFLPFLGAGMWLSVQKGDTHENVYGPVPYRYGVSESMRLYEPLTSVVEPPFS
jgi:uncharacterized membrane protein YhaH (DUF805 family)